MRKNKRKNDDAILEMEERGHTSETTQLTAENKGGENGNGANFCDIYGCLKKDCFICYETAGAKPDDG